MSRRNGGIIGPTNTPVGGLFKGVAGGVWRMNDVLTFVSNNQWPSGPQSIDNSCRFDDGSSDYLTKTFSSAGNRKTWTWSGWVKRCTLGAQQDLLSVSSGSSAYHLWYLDANDGVTHNYNGTYVSSAAKFRDTSAWYHFVCAVDTTQSTAADRVKMYVNGSQITSFDVAGYPSQDADLSINNSVRHDISNGGAHFSNNFYFDGYMAEVVFIDGQALDPTSFGETDSTTGIWKPKKIGSFTSAGDNSFYFDFKDSSNVGNDASGLNNDFTVNNLTSIDQSTDTCVVNYATFNSLWIERANNVQPAFSNGNLTATFDNGSTNEQGVSNIAVSTGKWYCEIKWDSATANTATSTGIFPVDYFDGDPFSSGYIYLADGTIRSKNSASSYGNSYTTGDIIGIALDLDNNKLYFSKNGTFQNSGVPTSGSTGTGAISITADTYYLYCSDYASSGNRQASANFGNPPFSISSGNSDANGFGNFEYSVPSGYYALNTTNLNTYG
tara:strand:- start:1075 stop:2562 length:1488 start_codon:yes stop_codon:yes gene_type:complete